MNSTAVVDGSAALARSTTDDDHRHQPFSAGKRTPSNGPVSACSCFKQLVGMTSVSARVCTVDLSLVVRYSGWKAHSDLATSSQQDKSLQSTEAAREVDAITWVGAFVNVGLAGFKVRCCCFFFLCVCVCFLSVVSWWR